MLAGVAARGSRDLLGGRKLALLCSVRCPGRLILRTYDLARTLRDAGVTVIGGFHTPMEQECLRLMLRGANPVIVCPARAIDSLRLPPDWQAAMDAGRLLLLSPFPTHQRRQTQDLALRRNAFVAELADTLFVAYATPGGQTERLAREAVAAGKAVLTLDDPHTEGLIALGAQVLPADQDWRAWSRRAAGST